MPVDVLIEDPRWEECRLQGLAETVIARALLHLGLDAGTSDVSVLGTDDARIAVLNSDFRGKPAPTNVLSWPEAELAAQVAGDTPPPPEAGPDGITGLGDIALSYDTCLREASDAGKSMTDHVTHLIVHGLLHLLGYDHIRDPDATLMERIETEILGKMGLDDPYNA